MSCKSEAIVAFALVLILIFFCIPMEAGGAEDQNPEEKTYANIREIHLADIDEVMIHLTDRSISEWIDHYLEDYHGYEFHVDPVLDVDVGLKRNCYGSGPNSTVKDSFAAFAELGLNITVKGNFPEPGKYAATEGETALQLFERIFAQEQSGEERELHLKLFLGVYADVELLWHVDADGDLDSVDIQSKILVKDGGKTDIILDLKSDDSTVEYIDLEYSDYKYEGNFYLNLQAVMEADGLKLISDQEQWENPVSINNHITKLEVSSDTVDSIWKDVVDIVGIDNIAKSKIPALILNILKSGDRMMDIFDTVRSLTGMKMPDMRFIADFVASEYIDDKDRHYTELIQEKDGRTVKLKLPLADYSLSVLDILDLVPSDVMGDKSKATIGVVLSLLGWSDIEVSEADQETVEKFEDISDHVDAAIVQDEEYDFKIPTGYLIIAIVGIIGCAAGVLVMRRRVQ